MSLWGFVLPVYRKRQLRNWMFLEGYILLANMDWFWFSLDFESRSSLPGALWASPVLILYKFHCYSWVDRKPSCALVEVRTKGWVLIKHEKISHKVGIWKGRDCWFSCRWNKLFLLPSLLPLYQTFTNCHKPPSISTWIKVTEIQKQAMLPCSSLRRGSGDCIGAACVRSLKLDRRLCSTSFIEMEAIISLPVRGRQHYLLWSQLWVNCLFIW